MITKQQRRDAIRQLVDLHGIRLGLPPDIRLSAVWLALTEYKANESSAFRAVEIGREVLDDVAEGYALLDGLEVDHG